MIEKVGAEPPEGLVARIGHGAVDPLPVQLQEDDAELQPRTGRAAPADRRGRGRSAPHSARAASRRVQKPGCGGRHLLQAEHAIRIAGLRPVAQHGGEIEERIARACPCPSRRPRSASSAFGIEDHVVELEVAVQQRRRAVGETLTPASLAATSSTRSRLGMPSVAARPRLVQPATARARKPSGRPRSSSPTEAGSTACSRASVSTIISESSAGASGRCASGRHVVAPDHEARPVGDELERRADHLACRRNDAGRRGTKGRAFERRDRMWFSRRMSCAPGGRSPSGGRRRTAGSPSIVTR